MDLHHICNVFGNCVLHNGKMKCLTWRHRKISGGKAVAVLFGNGKMTVTGNRTIYEAFKNCRKFVRLLQNHYWNVKLNHIKILAISVSTKFPNNIKPCMEYICANYGGVYEPELHNACNVRLKNTCVHVFPSGSINVTGLPNRRKDRYRLRKFIYNAVINGRLT